MKPCPLDGKRYLVLKINENSNEEDVQKSLAFIKQKSIQGSEKKRHDWSNGSESVPDGWRIRTNSHKHYVISPTGQNLIKLRVHCSIWHKIIVITKTSKL